MIYKVSEVEILKVAYVEANNRKQAIEEFKKATSAGWGGVLKTKYLVQKEDKK